MRHSQDTAVTQSGVKLRVTGNGILISPDPPDKGKSTSHGTLYFPDGAMEHVLLKATVMAVGTEKRTKKGKEAPIEGLSVGDRIVFVRFLAQQHSNLQMQDRYGGLVRIKPSDVIVVFGPEDEDKVLC